MMSQVNTKDALYPFTKAYVHSSSLCVVQVDKVETFKESHEQGSALHAKYSLSK